MTEKPNFLSIFPNKKPIMGMIHLKGALREDIKARALKEIEILLNNGVDAVLVENYFNHTRYVEVVLKHLHKHHPDYIYGVNILGNISQSFELASKYRAKFVQEDSVCGHRKPDADAQLHEKIIEIRKANPNIYLIGGVRFKYQPVRSGRTVEEDLKIGMTRCDAICVTGTGTGIPTELGKIQEFRNIIGDFPLIVGAGMTPSNAEKQLRIADGGIVGSYIKDNHQDVGDVSPKCVIKFMKAVRKARK